MFNINIGLLLFIIVVIGNVAALLIDLMLINNGYATISEVVTEEPPMGGYLCAFSRAGSYRTRFTFILIK